MSKFFDLYSIRDELMGIVKIGVVFATIFGITFIFHQVYGADSNPIVYLFYAGGSMIALFLIIMQLTFWVNIRKEELLWSKMNYSTKGRLTLAELLQESHGYRLFMQHLVSYVSFFCF